MAGRVAPAANAGLTRPELAALRSALLEQRTFRREQLRRIREVPTHRERVRRHTSALEEVQDCLAVAARVVLADVEAALDRMETGHYGRCCHCRDPIGLARLRICPQTLYCAECHRVREQG